MSRVLEVQRDVTRRALAQVGDSGFALAGSGAIREHGLISRPTEDVDLFTRADFAGVFSSAVHRISEALILAGYRVEDEDRMRAPQFARLNVRSEDGVDLHVDLGVDWRTREPVILDIGPVLSREDAVGSKVAALFSRGVARDYLDLDSIRQSGQFADDDLLTLASAIDGGFDIGFFARQLDAVRRFRVEDVAMYGVTEEQLDAIKQRCADWADSLRQR
jgi:hypothetical protein